jgi:hypothetical protein
MLFGSDCKNNTLRDVIGVKRGDTVGIRQKYLFQFRLFKIDEGEQLPQNLR